MSRCRSYCFTINNYTDEDVANIELLRDVAGYLVVGIEQGESGTPHLQGYVYFKEAKTFTSVKKKLPRAHIEVSKGTAEDNRLYCSKDNNLLVECGDIPRQGARTDIEKVIQDLKEGSNMRAVIDKARSIQSVKMAEVWLKYNEEGRDFQPEVRWYHGSTGSGKTKSAVEWLGPDYYTPLNFKWWEGYDAHENVLLDEVREDYCNLNDMLKMLDRYKYRVECKGGSRQLLAKKIAITSPYPPDKLFGQREDMKQLFRRIKDVIQCGELVVVYEFDLLEGK